LPKILIGKAKIVKYLSKTKILFVFVQKFIIFGVLKYDNLEQVK